MKALLVLCALASVAHADNPQREVADAVQEVLGHGFLGVTVYGPAGKELSSEQTNDLLAGGKAKLGKLTIGVLAERPTFGWFQGPLTIGTQAYRISGVYDQYSIAVVTISKVISDTDLIAAGKKAAQPMPAKALEGEDTPGRVAYWVSHGLTPPASVGWPSVVAASGTAPSEYAVGQAAVKKLIAGWDKLKMVPTSGEVTDYEKSLYLVHLNVMMPIKGTTLGVPMVLTAIVHSDGTYWQWQSLQFSPAL